jgi:REP element-mobilizing transposase RayT
VPQSLARILVHLIFSTKNRQPTIAAAVQPPLHAYLATVLQNHDCPSLQVGGTADHIHALFALSRTRSLAEVVEALKTSSSKWVKQQRLQSFAWQAGYGAFSVSESQLTAVIRYVARQEEHHRQLTFEDELRAFLTRHGIAYDERYVWD